MVDNSIDQNSSCGQSRNLALSEATAQISDRVHVGHRLVSACDIARRKTTRGLARQTRHLFEKVIGKTTNPEGMAWHRRIRDPPWSKTTRCTLSTFVEVPSSKPVQDIIVPRGECAQCGVASTWRSKSREVRNVLDQACILQISDSSSSSAPGRSPLGGLLSVEIAHSWIYFSTEGFYSVIGPPLVGSHGGRVAIQTVARYDLGVR